MSKDENTDTDYKYTSSYPQGVDKIIGAKVLLVEDNEINQQVAMESLEIEGFWVEVADNGQIAVDKVLNNNYDLVLMDLQMPVMDGYRATEIIRKEHNIQHLPIIALSADAMSGTREKVLNAGMNDYITKPIDIKALFESLVKWIKPGNHKKNVAKSPNKINIDKEVFEKYLNNLDYNDGLMRISGNTDVYLDILRRFSKDNKDFDTKLMHYLKEQDYQSAERLAHTLKGAAGNIGAKTLARLAADVEKSIIEKLPISIIDTELALVMEEIKVLLDQVGNLLSETNEMNSVEKTDGAEITKTEFLEELSKLAAAIREYDVAAEKMYGKMRGFVSNLKYHNEYEKMGEYLGNLDYEEALHICETIIADVKRK